MGCSGRNAVALLKLNHSTMEMSIEIPFQWVMLSYGAEDTSSFGVKPHDLIRDASSGQYEVSNFTPSTRVALGAAILRRVSNEWSAVGVLSSSTADTLRPVWLSRKNLSSLIRTVTGEPITAIEV
ncbi:hypothetical protein OS493_039346 [Desmophyllum pertusum]|uniref:Uncharacterized protein n=1 Tax=Desmophyllum pertusum TaxID=174260 RepID=A0A9W9YHD2_9CNID|nr:hypothetical protein OS493_039346 [Desmophyllum pertusum]